LEKAPAQDDSFLKMAADMCKVFRHKVLFFTTFLEKNRFLAIQVRFLTGPAFAYL
jgi:hypothetical protein